MHFSGTKVSFFSATSARLRLSMMPSPLKSWFICLVILALSGCAQKTTVALLADPDGHVGSLAVASDGGETELKRAAEATVVGGRDKKPTDPTILTEKQIADQFSVVLAALPVKPEHFILYFDKGSSNLAEDAEAMLQQILQSIANRKSKSISIVGHSDTAGDRDLNLRLSRDRTLTVYQVLLTRGVEKTHMTRTSHGKENPLIKTADNVDEPRNRRVEVIVR